jgi:rhodanese-related sulfurtransferase
MRLHPLPMWRRAMFAVVLTGAATSIAVEGAAEKVRPHDYDLRPDMTLDEIERRVAARHEVAEVRTWEAADLILRGEVVVFDVRSQAEYDEGHIPGAIRVDPDMTAAEFLRRFALLQRDRDAIFYCAVGERSGRLIRRVQEAVEAAGGRGSFNLRGSMFRWHLEGRPVVAKGQLAGDIHPYDQAWQRLLDAEKARR